MATSGALVRLYRRPWFLLAVGFLAGLIAGMLLAASGVVNGFFGAAVWPFNP